jgi:hypothetical protein
MKMQWMAWLCLSSAVSVGMVACGGAAGLEDSGQGPVSASNVNQCSNDAEASSAAIVEVNCGSIVNLLMCLYPEGDVTFRSKCTTQNVTIYFSEPDTLFTDSSSSVTLTPYGTPGSSVTKTVDTFAAPDHSFCLYEDCVTGPSIDSRTGEIDVYTSSPNEGF